MISYADKFLDGVMPTNDSLLRVIGPAPAMSAKHPRVYVSCSCGSPVKSVDARNLKVGRIRSCGCLRKQNSARLIKALHSGASRFIHGHAIGKESPEYHSWCQMKARCLNPTHPRYKDWGGRGITVCDRWVNSFTDFLADVGRKPSAAHSIDRIDNHGNYEPGNVKWSTPSEQNYNRRLKCLCGNCATCRSREYARQRKARMATCL